MTPKEQQLRSRRGPKRTAGDERGGEGAAGCDGSHGMARRPFLPLPSPSLSGNTKENTGRQADGREGDAYCRLGPSSVAQEDAPPLPASPSTVQGLAGRPSSWSSAAEIKVYNVWTSWALSRFLCSEVISSVDIN